MFERVIQDHLALKERNARLDGKMPIEGYKDADPFENHPLFKSEEQARIEETMDGVDPDFSDETLEDVGLGIWPGQQQGQQPGGAIETLRAALRPMRSPIRPKKPPPSAQPTRNAAWIHELYQPTSSFRVSVTPRSMATNGAATRT